MRRTAVVVAALLVSTSALVAQTPKIKPEIRPFVGAIIPTGALRESFADAGMVGAQLAVEVRPGLHVLGTFAWVPGQDKYGMGLDNVSIYQYDVGVELGWVEPFAADWELRPFIGFGMGGRAYAYEASALTDRHCAAGYGAVGTEFQLARTALRLEARDNFFCYRSPMAGVASATRNDIGLSLGVAYHLR